MESEQLQNFNERLSQWVANQGFWFQVRYSMAGSGMKGRAMFHLLRLLFRVLIFLLIVAVIVLVILLKRTESPRFINAFKTELKQGLAATDFQMRGFSRTQGTMEISRFAAEAGPDTFYSTLEVRNLRCKMSLIDGMVGVWKPGTISMDKLDLELRAGADDAETAHKIGQSIAAKSSKVDINALEVADATVHWGYFDRNRGAIESSSLKMQRTETGWRMIFKGGTFSQNWLTKLDIVDLVILCDKDGIVFEQAQLKQGDGTVDFSGLKIVGGERPQLDGVVKIHSLNLEGFLPAALQAFVEGSISGEFKVSGSTNTSDGLGFEGLVALDGKDSVITLRERLHILRALSVVDYSRNYHRIDFTEGSFQMKTIRGGMELSDVKLKSKDDLLNMDGHLNVRLPTQEEVKAAVEKGTTFDNSPLFAPEDDISLQKEAPKAETDFTLKRAAQEAKNVKNGTQSLESLTLFDRLGLSIEMQRLRNQESERMSRMLRYDGAFQISVPSDAFDRSEHLRKLYPVDNKSGRILVQVPVEGYLHELTLKQAEEIYQQRQN